MNKRNPGRQKQLGPWPKCKVENCTRAIEGGAKGFCHTHYVAARRGSIDMQTGLRLREPMRVPSYGPGALCSVEGCGRRPKGNNLCNMHWLRQKNDLPMGAEQLKKRSFGPVVICSVIDCMARAMSKGMCQSHATQCNNGLIDAQGNKLRDYLPRGRLMRERTTDSAGYVLIPCPENHPRMRADGKIFEHRLVMEQRLGRHLKEWELIHHKDGNRSNNNWMNLELIDGRAKKGEGHPPGHEFSLKTATQVLIQQENLPSHLKEQLLQYMESSK